MSAALELSDLAVGAIGQLAQPHTTSLQDVQEETITPALASGVEESEVGMSSRPFYRRQDSQATMLSSVHPETLGADIEPKVSVHASTDSPAGDVLDPRPITESYPPPSIIQATEPLPESPRLRKVRIGAAFFVLWLAGWNGGATGALLPHIETNYGINYARVSFLFVATFLGYVVAAIGAGTLSRKVGFGNAMCISVTVELIGNVINSSQQVNFGLMCFGFFVVGSAFASQFGLCNAYFALLPRSMTWTGILHGIYGLGAFASPLVATSMVTKGIPYHLFYMTNVGMNVIALAVVWFAYHDLQSLPQQPSEDVVGHAQAAVTSSSSVFQQTLRSKAVWTLACFLMLYVGAEESIGGWIVSYILEVRKGTPEGASWVASSFYLGLALGRIFLPVFNQYIGERLAVFLYLLCAIALEAVAWFVPIMASTAVSTALVGLAISTFYPTAIIVGGKLIPRSLHADAFALMSSVGQSGSALWPLVVGIMSTKSGIWVVEPTVVALLGAQGVCWWLVPRVGRRSD